ncbi:hypothetical protein ACCO45_006208 [Purpureocillium lilacinum]|uniref:Uncharacterized protein n=1 Tax=Purpureocillium lilacinum TaxID=33203 RepID=A0ACC4E077_PURLI
MTATLFEVAVLHLAWRMLGDGDETRRQELRYAYCSAVTDWLLLARRREARIVAADVRRWGLAAARRLDEPGRLEFVPPRRGSEGLEALTASQHSVVQPNPRGERPKTCLRRRASTVLAQWSVTSPLEGSSLPPQRIGCAANPCSAIQFGRATNSMRLQSCSAAMLCQCRRHEMNTNPALAARSAWGLGPCTPEQVAGTPLERALEHQTQGQACSSCRYGLQQEAGGAAQAGSWQLTIDAAIPSPTPSIPPLHGATPNQQPTSPIDLINQHRCEPRIPRSRQCHDPCAVPAFRLASSRPWSDPKSTDDDGAPLRWETNRRRFDAKNDAIRPFNTNTAPPSQFSGGQLPAT